LRTEQDCESDRAGNGDDPHTDDSRPLLTPERLQLPDHRSPPTRPISCTGFVSVDVKVLGNAGTHLREHKPPTTAPNMRQQTLEIEPPFGLPT